MVSQLEFLGEKLPQWMQVSKLIQGLNSKWNEVIAALLTNSETKTLTLEDVIGKLTMYGGIKQHRDDRLVTDKVKNIVLKVERAFDLAQTKEDQVDADDEVALITRAMKRL